MNKETKIIRDLKEANKLVEHLALLMYRALGNNNCKNNKKVA